MLSNRANRANHQSGACQNKPKISRANCSFHFECFGSSGTVVDRCNSMVSSIRQESEISGSRACETDANRNEHQHDQETENFKLDNSPAAEQQLLQAPIQGTRNPWHVRGVLRTSTSPALDWRSDRPVHNRALP